MICESFILEIFILILLLALYSYCGDKKLNTDSLKSIGSKSARTWQLKRPQGIYKLLWKTMSSVITWTKNHLSKQIITITYTL